MNTNDERREGVSKERAGCRPPALRLALCALGAIALHGAIHGARAIADGGGSWISFAVYITTAAACYAAVTRR
jgi:hypothetical protein